jgi:uracil-DNA glycosylase
MMTRDDVLRELELLPAWKLRVSTQVLETTRVEKAEMVAAPEVAKILYEITISSDKNWCFVCPAEHVSIASQGTLFSNILHALHIEKSTKMQTETLENIDAKMIVALGESVAQALLNSQESLENLRGKFHMFGGAQLLVTYDLAHLLANPADKAKTWEDLCMAKTAI